MPSDTPPDWYPDPTDPARERWWNGTAWTNDVRPTPSRRTAIAAGAAAGSVAAARSGPSVAALLTAGALLLVTVLVVVAVIVVTGGDRDQAGTSPPAAGGLPGTDEPGSGDDGDGADDPDDPTGGPDDTDGTEGPGDPDGPGTNGNDADVEPLTLDLDGACEVEVDPADVDGAQLRPWSRDECRWAPVDPGPGGTWIVVVASFDGAGMSGTTAEQRADGLGGTDGVLWSAHYPSLNPGWWVAYNGPYPDEDDALDAAAARGGGAYPRPLADEPGDRYCVADGGC